MSLTNITRIVAILALSACGPNRTSHPTAVHPAPTVPSNPTSLGGVTDGNGGTVIVCVNAYPQLLGRQVMVLDRFEAVSKGYQTSLGDPSVPALTKVGTALARIKDLDPRRFAQLSAWAASFMSDALIAPNLQLPNLPDVGPVQMPGSDCQVVNIAVQLAPQFPGDHLYTIKKELWDQLDTDDQATLVLHEITYRESKVYDPTTSRPTRNFVAALVGNQFATMSRADYAAFLRTWTNLPAIYQFQSQSFDLGTIAFYSSGRFRSGTPAALEGVNTYDEFPVKSPNVIDFYVDGNGGSATFADSDRGNLLAIDAGNTIGVMLLSMVWDQQGTGTPGSPVLQANCPIAVDANGEAVLQSATFYDDGEIKTLVPRGGSAVQCPDD